MKVLKLIQKQGFTRYDFLLMDDTLSVKQYTITGNKEWVVKLDHLGNKTSLEKEASLLRKLVSIFLGLCSLLMVIGNAVDHSSHMNIWLWIALSTSNLWLATAMYFTPSTNELRLIGGLEELVFLSDKPSEKEVREFVNEIIRRSKKVLTRKYRIDPDLPENIMISQLSWLFELGIIDNEEFSILKATYYSYKKP